MKNTDLQNLTHRLTAFRDARDWKQFHNLKDLIVSLNLEASELLELTQWQNGDDFEDRLQNEAVKARLREECGDVLAYLLLIAERADIDLVQCTHDKIDLNEKKYPVEKSKGNATKYNQRE